MVPKGEAGPLVSLTSGTYGSCQEPGGKGLSSRLPPPLLQDRAVSKPHASLACDWVRAPGGRHHTAPQLPQGSGVPHSTCSSVLSRPRPSSLGLLFSVCELEKGWERACLHSPSVPWKFPRFREDKRATHLLPCESRLNKRPIEKHFHGPAGLSYRAWKDEALTLKVLQRKSSPSEVPGLTDPVCLAPQ